MTLLGTGIGAGNSTVVSEGLGGPLHIWLFTTPIQLGARYYGAGTIYEAPSGRDRYQNATFQGVAILPNFPYLRMGTVYWTGFAPKSQRIRVFLNLYGKTIPVESDGTLPANIKIQDIPLIPKSWLGYTVVLEGDDAFETSLFYSLVFRLQIPPKIWYYREI
jgi:hypothetical protein